VTDTIGGLAGDWSQMLEQRARKGGLSALAPEYAANMQLMMDREADTKQNTLGWANLQQRIAEHEFDLQYPGGTKERLIEIGQDVTAQKQQLEDDYANDRITEDQYKAGLENYARNRRIIEGVNTLKPETIETSSGTFSSVIGPDGTQVLTPLDIFIPERHTVKLSELEKQAEESRERLLLTGDMLEIASRPEGIKTGAFSNVMKHFGTFTATLKGGAVEYSNVLARLQAVPEGQPIPQDLLDDMEEIEQRFSANELAVINTQEYDAVGAQMVGKIIKLFGAGTGLSDADREFAQFASGLTSKKLNTAGVINILRRLQVNDDRVIKRYANEHGRIRNLIPTFLPPETAGMRVDRRASLEKLYGDFDVGFKSIDSPLYQEPTRPTVDEEGNIIATPQIRTWNEKEGKPW